VFGFYHESLNYKNQLPNKKFCCFVRRACPVRQSWFYFFIRHDLLDQAHLSYLLGNLELVTGNLKHFEEYYFAGNQIFEKEHTWAVANLTFPYKNFTIPKVDAIIDSERSLIFETFFSEENIITFSHKTFQALQLPRPVLIFGHKGIVSQFRDWGFDMYDDIIDHSYDLEPDFILRQQLILDQLTVDINYTEELLQNFEQRATHNQNLLKQYKKEWPMFLETIYKQIKGLA